MLTKSFAPYSVVIPVFNNGIELEMAVLSAMQQTCPPSEIIICDDASTSTQTKSITSSFLSRFPALFRVVINSVNAGAATTRNAGIKASGCEIVAFLDADDAWLLNKMENQLILFNFPTIIACGCRFDSDRLCILGDRFITSLSTQDLLFRNYIQPSTFVARRSSLLEVGMFPEGQRHAEEGDLYLKLSGIEPILFLNSKLVNYNTRSLSGSSHQQAARLSANAYRMYLGNLKNIWRAYDRGQIARHEVLFFGIFMLFRYIYSRIVSPS